MLPVKIVSFLSRSSYKQKMREKDLLISFFGTGHKVQDVVGQQK